MKIGLDAKRIVRNGTGLGSYGRNLANDLAGIIDADTRLLLYVSVDLVRHNPDTIT